MKRRGRWGGWSDFPPSPPKLAPPERGIKVRRLGATWWGQRWIEALERMSRDYSGRLGRGRTYARAGRVHDLTVQPGKVTAFVTGSRPRPYAVTLSLAALGKAAWDRAVAQMASQAVFTAELLAGEMPKEIDSAFREAGTSLFPVQSKDLVTKCSCPDWANPCKHVAAVHYVLGEAFDKDPFLLFELRGRDREAVLAALRSSRAPSGAAEAAEENREAAIPAVSWADLEPDAYERPAARSAPLVFRFEPPATPGALFRHLGTPPSWSLEESPADLLGPLSAAAGALAREMALRSGEEVAEESGEEQGGAVKAAKGAKPGRLASSSRVRKG